jgi:hypothetical protein
MKKVITRLKGGLGNQLFCYAAARRLALVNSAELVIDNVTGFVRDRLYNRQYALEHFHIGARKATRSERLQPFDRYRRALAKWRNHGKPFLDRSYLEQEGIAFDARLLQLRVEGTVYLDGLWQSESYFKDIEPTIRADLRIVPPADATNQALGDEIRSCNSVALHVRWFDAPDGAQAHNASAAYYRRAVALLNERVPSARYFLFSDDPEAARVKLGLAGHQVVPVAHNRGDTASFADLWLMSQCRHFIIANSTFSWWGAWLSENQAKIVVTPDLKLNAKTAWGFQGLIPSDWIRVNA